MKEKIYLASPWFNDEQAEREERIKNKLRKIGFNVYSPRENGVLKPSATKEDRIKIFNDNIKNIVNCDILFAITDGKDIGTIWEAGFACGFNFASYERTNKMKIIYYCESLNDGKFNVMLAESADVVLTEFKELDNLDELIRKGKDYAGDVE